MSELATPGSVDSQLVANYLRAAWVMKIRLQSSRKTLWNETFSVIHFENAALQIRKITENVTQLCLLLADMEYGDLPKSRKQAWNALDILQYLKLQQKLKFPDAARLVVKEIVGENRVWEMHQHDENPSDLERFKNVTKNTQRLLHDHSKYLDVVSHRLNERNLGIELNAIRADHQWLWNRFWQHAVTLRGKLFFVSLGNELDTSRPTLISEEKLFHSDIDVTFDPKILADFDGELNWNEYI